MVRRLCLRGGAIQSGHSMAQAANTDPIENYRNRCGSAESGTRPEGSVRQKQPQGALNRMHLFLFQQTERQTLFHSAASS